jgi:gluconokinase
VILVVMGVSGCGKTTLGRALAARLGWGFLDADDFHPPANVAKMRSATPLDDADRAAWIEALRRELEGRLSSIRSTVLACSALRARHRDRLHRPGEPVRFIYLKGDFETIHRRLASRRGHYMPAALLESQFAALEEPADAFVVPVTLPLAEALDRVIEHLRKITAK